MMVLPSQPLAGVAAEAVIVRKGEDLILAPCHWRRLRRVGTWRATAKLSEGFRGRLGAWGAEVNDQLLDVFQTSTLSQ